MSSRTLLDDELPVGFKFTPGENLLIDESAAHSQVVNQAKMIANLYATKITRMLIESNENLAKANEKHAIAQNWLTSVLAVATIILAVATVFLVIATYNLVQ